MLALSGKRTLLIDLDPSGDATASLGLPRCSTGKTLEGLADPWGLLKAVVTVECSPGLDLWTGGPAVEELRAELNQQTDPPTDLLDQGLELARQRYSAVVIDSPPDLGSLGCNALRAADVLLLPLSETTFAERAWEETIATAFALRGSITVLGVRVKVRDDEQSAHSLEEEETLRGPLGIELLDCPIAYDAQTLIQATKSGLPIFEFDPASRAARCFVELAREVQAKILAPSRLTPVSGIRRPSGLTESPPRGT
jgi:chromosome partitioning protein